MFLIIIGAISSGKTALWHNLLGKRTGQEEESNKIKNKFYLTVKNGQWKVIGMFLYDKDSFCRACDFCSRKLNIGIVNWWWLLQRQC